MHCDACQPGGEPGPPGKLVQMFVRANVGVLHYIFGFAIITENRPSYAVEALVVTAHDDFKHPRLARQHSGHYFLVTQGLLRGGHFRWVDHTNPPLDGVDTAIKVTDQIDALQKKKSRRRPVTDSLLRTPFC